MRKTRSPLLLVLRGEASCSRCSRARSRRERRGPRSLGVIYSVLAGEAPVACPVEEAAGAAEGAPWDIPAGACDGMGRSLCDALFMTTVEIACLKMSCS